MTSSSPSQKSEQGGRTDSAAGRQYLNNQVLLKEELRQSIIAKRHARGEKQLKIELSEPEEMALTPAEEEKKERRREQNRRAAQRCRHKKRLNQKHVIQNYEQVVARNEELQKELDAARRELNKLRNTCGKHFMCCPSLAKVKPESNQVIKLEPMAVDELPIANTQDSVCSHEYSRKKTSGADISRFNTPNIFAHSSQADTSVKPSTSSIKQQQQIGVILQETDFLQPPHSHSTGTSQGLQWDYTCGRDENNSPTSHMLTGLNPEFAALLLSAQLQVDCQKHLRHQKQDYELQPQQGIGIENVDNINSIQLPHAGQFAATQSAQLMNTHRYTFLDDAGYVVSQNSPCHVVPSLRSPRPDSVTSTVSCTFHTIRHRSLSGGSGCTSDAPRRCGTEGEFSSVSSEGSWSAPNMYQDWRTLEVVDTDTDDVFMNPPTGANVPLDGHDDNNNLETLPDNNMVSEAELFQLLQTRPSVIDWLSSTPESTNSTREDADGASDPTSVIIDSDDVSPLIQLSSADLQLFTDIENGEQPYDYLSTILPATQRIDY